MNTVHAGLIAVVACTMTVASAPDHETRLMTRLAGATVRLGARPVEARIDDAFGPVPFAPTRGNIETGAQFRAELYAVMSDAEGSSRAAAVTLLLLGDADGAIARLDPLCVARHAAVCSDLAAALLEHARASTAVLPIIDALAAADRAGGTSAALFNRGLALDALAFHDEARNSFLAAAAAAPGTPLATEALRYAHRHRADAALAWDRSRGALEEAAARDDVQSIREIVGKFPEETRRWAESVWQVEWAKAALAQDHVAEERVLQRVRFVAAALEQRAGDALLADAVAAIGAASRNDLARAYIRYDDGRQAHRADDPSKAARVLRDAAAQFQSAGSPMAFVARYYEASALYAANRLAEAEALLVELRRQLSAHPSYRSLRAMTGWEFGLTLLQSGRISEAIDVFSESREALTALGENQTAASFEGFLASAYELVGDAERAWSHRRDAFVVQRDPRRRIANLGAAIAGAIARSEWPRAEALLNLAGEIAERNHDIVAIVNTLQQRSMVAARAGDERSARRHIATISRWRSVDVIAAILPRIEAGVAFTEGLLARDHNATASVAAFTRAIRYYEQARLLSSAPATYLELARTQRAMGSLIEALRSIDSGLVIAEQQRDSVRAFEDRAQMLATMRELFDEGVATSVAAGLGERAFALAERARGRAVLEHFTGRVVPPLALPEIQRALAPDAAIVEYVSVGESVFAFVIRTDRFSVQRLSIKRQALLYDAERLLMAPLSDSLAGVRQLAIVPDGELLAIPFSALLSEQYAVFQSPSATLAVQCSRRARRLAISNVVAIGATNFDTRQFPALQPLPRVEEEVRSVAMFYPRRSVVTGEAATASRVTGLLGKASVIHFAGHGINLGDRPLQPALLVAPDPPASSWITLTDILDQRLDRTSLVFLSTCRAAQTAWQRDGAQNMATAFIAAGAPAVIGSMNDIDDDDARELAILFHGEFARAGDAATALREVARKIGVRNSSVSKTFLLGGTRAFVVD